MRGYAVMRMMKALTVAAALACVASGALADQYVRGYTRQNGTYVQPHMRTTPNGTPFDNYSTRGNVNPYTGQAGTRNPYAVPSMPSVPYVGAPTVRTPQVPCYGYGCR